MERSNKQIYKRGDMIVFVLNDNPTEQTLYPGNGARGTVQDIRRGGEYEAPGVNNTQIKWEDGRMKGQTWWYPAERLRHMSMGGF